MAMRTAVNRRIPGSTPGVGATPSWLIGGAPDS
jgi:hypothetical protein